MDEERPVLGERHSKRDGVAYRVSLGVAGIVAAGVIVAAVMSRSPGDEQPVSAASSQELSDQPTEEELKASGNYPTAADDARLEQQKADGFVPYSPQPGMEGIEVPEVAWLEYVPPVGGPDGLTASLGEANRFSVYDAPHGNIIGYLYGGLGYVPAEIADSSDFDATEARAAR